MWRGEVEADHEGDQEGDDRLDQPRAQLDQMFEQRRLGGLDLVDVLVHRSVVSRARRAGCSWGDCGAAARPAAASKRDAGRRRGITTLRRPAATALAVRQGRRPAMPVERGVDVDQSVAAGSAVGAKPAAAASGAGPISAGAGQAKPPRSPVDFRSFRRPPRTGGVRARVGRGGAVDGLGQFGPMSWTGSKSTSSVALSFSLATSARRS